jgi:L-2-hydroxycarboxylate dehydrogenase (NAD+)
MAYLNWKHETLQQLCLDAFQKFGFTEENAQIITDVLLLSDLYGIESHGMQRLVRYHKGIEKGMIKIDAEPEVVFETPVSAVIDGHDGMGQLIGYKAMNIAINKAKENGVGIVSVRNSNHYGIPVNENTMIEILDMCNYLNMDFSKYFGNYTPVRETEVFKGNY